MRDRTRLCRRSLVAAVGLWIGLSPTALAAERSLAPGNPYRPSPREEARVAELADAALAERELDTTERIHRVATRILRDKEAEARGEPGRVAVVTYYRYEGDLTIFVRVDTARGEVLGVETASSVPTPLSKDEFEQAKRIALRDPKIAAALEERRDEVEIEPLVVRTVSEDDPLFGHRAVRLLFKTKRGYLRRPIVVVDLTARRAFIEQPPADKVPAYPGTARPKR